LNRDTSMWFIGDDESWRMAMHPFFPERDLQSFLEKHSEVLGDLIMIAAYVKTNGTANWALSPSMSPLGSGSSS
jgi:hypothetical protein